MAIQNSNAVCVMGCPKDNSSGLEGLIKFQVHEAEELYIFIPNIFLTTLNMSNMLVGVPLRKRQLLF